MSSSSSWKPPSWSKIPPPSQQWTLDELKNGVLVKTHSLNNLLSSQPTNHNNNRRCITFGRIDDPSQIDIVTAHESCSRLHARIAFTAHNGTPYLKDLGSGNGTFVNNRQLPPEACGKWEYTNDDATDTQKREVRGSRGVVIYPGDAIRFGCSSRIYLLEGPEEFERGATPVVGANNNLKKDEEEKMIISNDDGNEHKEVSAAAEMKETEEVVCNWGISTAEYSDEEQDSSQQQQSSSSLQNNNNTSNDSNSINHHLPSIDTFFSTPSKYKITNPLQQLYNQYTNKLYKLTAITNESNRITSKQDIMGVELTDGQRNQLIKNQEKLTALENSIRGLKEKIEEGMYLAIYGKSMMNRRVSSQGGRRDDRAGGDDDDDDVDDFFDRTSSSSKRQRHDNADTEEAESEASLVQKWKVLLQSYSKQQTIVSSKTHQCHNLQRQIDTAGDDDEEDAFFIQNDLNLVKDDVTKATGRLEEMECELKDVERLLKIVNSKLRWDREEGLIGTDLHIGAKKSESEVSKAEHSAGNGVEEQNDSAMIMMPPSPKTAAAASTVTTASFDMPPPPPTMTTTAATATSTMSSFDMMPPPPKVTARASEPMSNTAEKEVITAHTTNPDGATPQEKEEQTHPLPPPKKKRQLGPMRPPQTTPGTQGTLAAFKQFSSTSNNAKKQKKTSNNNDSSTTTTFDPRKDEWSAPSDQDGSGRTSLHDKFKGRY